MVKIGENEKHVKYEKTREFYENRRKFEKVGGEIIHVPK